MNSHFINYIDLAQTIGLVSLVACPLVCAAMAHQISRSYAQQPFMGLDLSSQPQTPVAAELSPTDEAAINEAVKNAIF